MKHFLSNSQVEKKEYNRARQNRTRTRRDSWHTNVNDPDDGRMNDKWVLCGEGGGGGGGVDGRTDG